MTSQKMKKLLFYIFILGVTAFAVSCGNNSKQVDEAEVLDEWPEPEPVAGVQIFGNGSDSCTFKMGDKQYLAKVSRITEGRDTVYTDDGNKYIDNAYKLTVLSGGSTLMNYTFTKSDFRAYIDSKYIDLSKSVISALVYVPSEDTNATFYATVEMPGMSKEMTIKISMDKTGGISMCRFSDEPETEAVQMENDDYQEDGI